jgi:hypothetical protein
MHERLEIAKSWLPRYTGMPLDLFGDYILLTNFRYYLTNFAEKFKCDIYGDNKPMQAATNDSGLTIVHFGIGTANVATITDLLSACHPKGALFLDHRKSDRLLDPDRQKEEFVILSRGKCPGKLGSVIGLKPGKISTRKSLWQDISFFKRQTPREPMSWTFPVSLVAVQKQTYHSRIPPSHTAMP